MKKGIFLGAGAIVIGTAAATPFWFGGQIENQFQAQVSELKNNTAIPPWMKMRVDQYQSGWLSSTAQTTFTIDLANFTPPDAQADLPKTIDLVFNHTIKHGPFSDSQLVMGVIESTLVVPDEYATIVEHYFGNQSPLQQTTAIYLNGESVSKLTVPPYEGPSHDNKATINWQGLNGTMHGQWQVGEGSGKLSAPLLQISSDNGNATFRSLTIDGKTRLSPEGLTLSNGSFAIDELGFQGRTPEGKETDVQLTGLKFKVASDQQANLVSATETISFGKLLANNELDLGPGELAIEVRNLDANTLVKMQENFQAIERSATTLEQRNEAFAFALLEALPELLRHSPQINFNKLQLTTDKGQINGHLKFAFDGTGADDINLQIPATLVPHLNMDFKASLPLALTQAISESLMRSQIRIALQQQEQEVSAEEFEQLVANATQQQLANLEQNGILVNEGEHYTAHLNFAAGKLTLNGKPADQLLGLLPIPNNGNGS